MQLQLRYSAGNHLQSPFKDIFRGISCNAWSISKKWHRQVLLTQFWKWQHKLKEFVHLVIHYQCQCDTTIKSVGRKRVTKFDPSESTILKRGITSWLASSEINLLVPIKSLHFLDFWTVKMQYLAGKYQFKCVCVCVCVRERERERKRERNQNSKMKDLYKRKKLLTGRSVSTSYFNTRKHSNLSSKYKA